jgi:hypothetical protein
MKVIDKIAMYNETQKQANTTGSMGGDQTPKLPALSLEFFPPKTQEGVMVRDVVVAAVAVVASSSPGGSPILLFQ